MAKKKLRTQWTKNEDAFDEEWRFLPNDYEADALVAIDPGMRSLCTAVSEGGVKNMKATRARHVGAEPVHSISTKEYRHVAGMNKARFWHENLKKRKKRNARVIAGISSYKISSFEKYLWRLKTFRKHVSFLLAFCAANAFLEWRFFQSRMKVKAADAMAKRIVPVTSSGILVGYGDRSCRDGISGPRPESSEGIKESTEEASCRGSH